MKKTLFPIVLVSALMTIISCAKSFDAQEEGLVASSETKTFTATIESDDTKTILKDKSVFWSKNDRIAILDNSGTGNCGVYTAIPKDPATQATFTFAKEGTAASTPKFVAYYPASICWSGTEKTAPTLPATQPCDGTFALSPMYAFSKDTNLEFKNICSVIKLKTNFANVSSIELSTSDKNLSGPFTINPENYAMTMSGTAADDKKVTLNVANDYTPTADNEGYYYYYIAIPAQQYSTLTIKVTAGGNTKTMTKTMPSESSLARNTIYNLTFKADFVALTGVFSVSSDIKVRFSPGNLYYDGNALHFEAYQWTTQTAWSASHVSHFYWTNDIAKSASITTSDTGDTFFADVNNKQTIDGKSDWYTLSQAEFEYLLGFSTPNRSDDKNNNYLYAIAKVNGINGFLIFPDEYSGTTTGDGIAVVNSPKAEFPKESIPNNTWSSMEKDGCVFLPVAGSRGGNKVKSAGSSGIYWSSTAGGSNNAYHLRFDNGITYVGNGSRINGFSVRLVRESN